MVHKHHAGSARSLGLRSG